MDNGSNSVAAEKLREVKTILVSQPQPSSKSPYADLEAKYDVKVDFRPFMHVEPVVAKDFRKQKIYLDQYTAIVFVSRSSIEHYFRLAEEMRFQVPDSMKYFCKNAAVANYLSKYIVYRKRKIFHGTKTFADIKSTLVKNKKETFLFPCSNITSDTITSYFKSIGITIQEAIMYNSVASNLSDLRDIFYDVLVFFSPLEIQSLFKNFPKFEQLNTRIAVWGKGTLAAVEEHNLIPNIIAPTPELKSMAAALEDYISRSNAGV